MMKFLNERFLRVAVGQRGDLLHEKIQVALKLTSMVLIVAITRAYLGSVDPAKVGDDLRAIPSMIHGYANPLPMTARAYSA